MNIMMAEFGSAGHIHVELAFDAMNVSNYGSLGAPKNVPWSYDIFLDDSNTIKYIWHYI